MHCNRAGHRRMQAPTGLAVLFFFCVLQPNSPAISNDTMFEVSATKFLMGTQVDLRVQHRSVQQARLACYQAFREMERIENLLSSRLDSSDIARINRHAGRAPVKVTGETLALLQRALAYGEKTNGLFDITIGALTRLWGFDESSEIRLPDIDRLTALRRHVNYRKLVLDSRAGTAMLLDSLAQVDLGGIAKGYAIDRAAAVLLENGIKHFLVNAGGDIFASGEKAAGQAWRVGIRHPRQAGALLAKLEMRDGAIATSGDYERFLLINGQRYHHILDPRTGFPAPYAQSVTVIAPTAEEADVWATALFIAGSEQPAWPVHFALIVDANGTAHFDAAKAQKWRMHLLPDAANAAQTRTVSK